MKNMIHSISAALATLCIFIFLIATVLAEAFGSLDTVSMVKGLIVLPGLFILIPAIIATGVTGFTLAKERNGELVKRKKKRMPFIGVNGVFILLPSAIFLNMWASSGVFDTTFYVVQGIELMTGLINLVLMAMNMRDGLQMSGKIRGNYPRN